MMHKKEMARTQRILKKKEQAKRQTEVVASAKPSQTYAEHIQMHHETMKKKMHEQYHAAKKQPKDECGGRVDVGEVCLFSQILRSLASQHCTSLRNRRLLYRGR